MPAWWAASIATARRTSSVTTRLTSGLRRRHMFWQSSFRRKYLGLLCEANRYSCGVPGSFHMARVGSTALLVGLVALLGFVAAGRANLRGTAGPITYADNHGVHLLDPSTGASRLIGRHGHVPVLFPGSRRFAYVREAGTAAAPDKPGYAYREVQVVVKRLSEGAAAVGRPLFGPKAFFATGLSVTPSGLRVVFAGKRGFGPGRSKGHDFEIWSIAVAGGEVRRLTDDNYRDTDPEVSPDGGQIAFARRVHGRAQIFVMDRDGSHQRRLTFDPHRDRAPSWSPNGRRLIYFQQQVSRDPNGHSRELFTVPVAGGNPKRLTHDKLEQSFPVYSPDGRHIAFVQERALWVMPATGGPAHPLTEIDELGPPDWGTR